MSCAYRILLIDNSLVKLFRSFNGGYTDSDSWTLNSGTKKIEVLEDGYIFHGYSGSSYFVPKRQGLLNSFTSGVYGKMLEQEKVEEISIEQAIEIVEELE